LSAVIVAVFPSNPIGNDICLLKKFSKKETEEISPFLEEFFNKNKFSAVMSPFVNAKINNVLVEKFMVSTEGNREIMAEAARSVVKEFSQTVQKTVATVEFWERPYKQKKLEIQLDDSQKVSLKDLKLPKFPADQIENVRKLEFSAVPFDQSPLQLLKCESSELCLEISLMKKRENGLKRASS